MLAETLTLTSRVRTVRRRALRTLICMTGLSEAELDAMAEEATVLGVTVTVTAVTHMSHGLVADCARGRHRQAIHVLDLPLPDPPPKGAEWIAAYRRWAR